MAQEYKDYFYSKIDSRLFWAGLFSMKALQVQVGDVVNVTNTRLGSQTKTLKCKTGRSNQISNKD